MIVPSMTPEQWVAGYAFAPWQEDIEAEFQEWEQAIDDLLEMTSVATHKRCPNLVDKTTGIPRECKFCKEHFGDPMACWKKQLIVNGAPSAKRNQRRADRQI